MPAVDGLSGGRPHWRSPPSWGLNRAARCDAHQTYPQAVAAASVAASEDTATRAGPLRQLAGQLAVSDAELAAFAA